MGGTGSATRGAVLGHGLTLGGATDFDSAMDRSPVRRVLRPTPRANVCTINKAMAAGLGL